LHVGPWPAEGSTPELLHLKAGGDDVREQPGFSGLEQGASGAVTTESSRELFRRAFWME
jgi:hypothetical protein